MLKSQDHRWSEKGALLATLPPGDRLIIDYVVDYPYGSTGRCWVIKVRLLDSDVEDQVEIPSCWVWDDPIWIEPRSPHSTKDADRLRMVTHILRPIERC